MREGTYERQYGRKRPARVCTECSVPIPAGSYRTVAQCSDECRKARKRNLDRAQRRRERLNGTRETTHRARARRFGVEYEPVNKWAVFERDGWRCGICRCKVNKKLRHPHPMSASLDHVIPMSLGGGHTYLNTQLAHLQCNVDKGAGGTDQLALLSVTIPRVTALPSGKLAVPA